MAVRGERWTGSWWPLWGGGGRLRPAGLGWERPADSGLGGVPGREEWGERQLFPDCQHPLIWGPQTPASSPRTCELQGAGWRSRQDRPPPGRGCRGSRSPQGGGSGGRGQRSEATLHSVSRGDPPLLHQTRSCPEGCQSHLREQAPGAGGRGSRSQAERVMLGVPGCADFRAPPPRGAADYLCPGKCERTLLSAQEQTLRMTSELISS